MDFETLFKMGMDRDLPELLDPPEGLSIGLGESGAKNHGRDMSLGLPDWSWPEEPIPAKDGSAGIIHAYHFFEHLTGEQAIDMLFECQRVLKPGGVLQFCMPWAKTECALHDLTHKSWWCETSFKNLFNNYYDPTPGRVLKFRQHYLVLAGIVERNIAVMGQLVREEG